MADPLAATADAAEPLFRANKRRKVFRKRTEAEDEDDDVPASMTPPALESVSNGSASKIAEPALGVLRVDKRATTNKRGIGFSSTQQRRQDDAEEDTEGRAVTLAPQTEVQDVSDIDRFVRPTGRVGVTEDKHMYEAKLLLSSSKARH